MIKESNILINLNESILNEVPTKDMEVFYNPIMQINRDLSCLLLYSLKKMGHRIENIALPTCGSGIRGIRFLKNIENLKIYFNDLNPKAIDSVKENLKINNLLEKKENYELSINDANLFLLNNKFDYIDIDPFGSPNPFLQSAILSLTHDGILAVTATDTAAFCGTYPRATLRKYFSKSIRTPYMHEFGIRILIKHIIEIASQFEIAMIPIFYHSNDHYFRVYLKKLKSKSRTLELIKEIKNVEVDDKNNFFIKELGESYTIGPMYVGKLKRFEGLFEEMNKNKDLLNLDKKSIKLFSKINEELDEFCFYNLHEISRNNSTNPISIKKVIENTKATRTHFCDNSVKIENKEELFNFIEKNSNVNKKD
ncbi:MAG: hypothetical protein PHT94_03745 [Candidatus Nanoarchaeia archaeon]|nr:hypothetical protein [Candidatus Nanoarchaeia archaeon]